MVKFHDAISKKINDKYFGIKVHVALKKGHLPDHEVEKFTKNAINAYHRALAYIEKWYPFENQNYKTFSLKLECGRLPTLDQLLDIWSISPWKQQTPPEQIYDELAALQSVFPSLKLESNSIEMWCKFFQKEEAPNLLKIVQFVCSVPVSNAFVERIFSVMGNVWTDERNHLAVNTVKNEIINLSHEIGGDGFNTFSHDDIDELLVGDALSDNDIIDLTLDLTVDGVVGLEGDNDEEEKSTPLTGKLIQDLQLCRRATQNENEVCENPWPLPQISIAETVSSDDESDLEPLRKRCKPLSDSDND
ncbi:dimer_Tnp_hAT domain-containing protein [Trichonephila clavipes]|nr:dimer_Tnp_hAT domain-containing protein [Trichonephila clavipes]